MGKVTEADGTVIYEGELPQPIWVAFDEGLVKKVFFGITAEKDCKSFVCSYNEEHGLTKFRESLHAVKYVLSPSSSSDMWQVEMAEEHGSYA